MRRRTTRERRELSNKVVAITGDAIYREVQGAIQAGMDRLAKRRSFPIFG
jgi:hypothetical protein